MFQPVEASLLGDRNVAVSADWYHTAALQWTTPCTPTDVPNSDKAANSSI
eukprot:SAG22_NODE_18253_length_290_cov_1.010471_1_plen_49_part_01